MTTQWHPPGEGQWKRDDVHITTVLTGLLEEQFIPAQAAGFAEGFAYYGAMLAGFDRHTIAGRVYMRAKIAGAPPQKIWGDNVPAKIKGPGKPPPKLIFKLLFALHPELRKRAKRAKQVWEQRVWREMCTRWFEEMRPRSVFASAHTESALAYRKKMGVAGTPRMGVVIQTLLRPDISGVLFSKDPTAAREGRVIEATWGLGEALVAGLVTPDRYRIGRDGKVLERAIGDKDIAIEARDGGGTAEVAIAGERAKTACLDDARLAELAQLASRCEQLFGGPQDLEWAVANGRLHLLQSRPVTTT